MKMKISDVVKMIPERETLRATKLLAMAEDFHRVGMVEPIKIRQNVVVYGFYRLTLAGMLLSPDTEIDVIILE